MAEQQVPRGLRTASTKPRGITFNGVHSPASFPTGCLHLSSVLFSDWFSTLTDLRLLYVLEQDWFRSNLEITFG